MNPWPKPATMAITQGIVSQEAGTAPNAAFLWHIPSGSAFAL